MAESESQPGEGARAGGTIAQILASDAKPAPAPLTAEAYAFLGDADLPASRYTCPDFFRREMSAMWSRTWQWACREEHIPGVGDHYVYDIGPYSVIVTRVAEMRSKPSLTAAPTAARGCSVRKARALGNRLTAPFTVGPGISMAH